VTRIFRRLPIRVKLIAMITTVSGAVLLLASLGYLIMNNYQTREELRADLESQADLILKNSDSALAFDDTKVAQQTLATLQTKPNIRLACLYDERDALFADYRAADRAEQCPPSSPPQDGSRFGPNRLEFSRTGMSLESGKKFGSVLLRSDLEAIARRGRIQLGIVALLLGIAIAAAVTLSWLLQSVVSDPVSALARTAQEVSNRGDYSLRATRTTEDELGLLVDEFNRMLERIEQRESELSTTNDELRKEVAERRKAEQERAELLVREREANRLKDEFLATLSHELRTPLNAVLGWIRLLRANAVPANSIERALEKVERNAQAQARLIEDLLEISRIVSGKLRLEYRSFDLVALCTAAIDSIRPMAEGRGIAVMREFEATSLPATGDPDRLQQVVWNLLSNAVKFTHAGGTVTVRLRRSEGVDELEVSDTGIGIDPDFLPSVFETFRQGDASSTRTHGGLGLGLSIVKRLVELHGGEVHAFSAGTNKGSTFTVRLPVRSENSRGDVNSNVPMPNSQDDPFETAV
jgi:signal transduction histidine kinase